MKAIALALAIGLAVAGPVWAQGAEPVRGERPEAERHLVPCEQFPNSEHDCHAIRRVFLNAYDKAMRGDRSGQSLVATMLTVGARIPGKPQSYVVTDPVEGCAWRMVAAGDRSDRHNVNTVRSFCNHLMAPDRAAAEARAQSLTQDIAAPAVATHQAARDAERLPDARRTEARSQQDIVAAWRGERPARPAPAMSQSGADDFAGRQAVAPPVVAVEITGRVVGISDGDTLTVLSDTRQPTRVRLAEIDTPEAGQPYGSRARQALSDLAFGKSVRVVVQDTDRYGRSVGRVYEGAVDVNAEMVRQGAAWVYRQYSRDPSLLRLEQEAQAAKRGLWALPEAERTPPWEWRAAERGGQGQAAATPAAPPAAWGPAPNGFTCGAKRVCREMTSCAEARFYLSQCGLSRLDSDGDGIPCEAICR